MAFHQVFVANFVSGSRDFGFVGLDSSHFLEVDVLKCSCWSRINSGVCSYVSLSLEAQGTRRDSWRLRVASLLSKPQRQVDLVCRHRCAIGAARVWTKSPKIDISPFFEPRKSFFEEGWWQTDWMRSASGAPQKPRVCLKVFVLLVTTLSCALLSRY